MSRSPNTKVMYITVQPILKYWIDYTTPSLMTPHSSMSVNVNECTTSCGDRGRLRKHRNRSLKTSTRYEVIHIIFFLNLALLCPIWLAVVCQGWQLLHMTYCCANDNSWKDMKTVHPKRYRTNRKLFQCFGIIYSENRAKAQWRTYHTQHTFSHSILVSIYCAKCLIAFTQRRHCKIWHFSKF